MLRRESGRSLLTFQSHLLLIVLTMKAASISETLVNFYQTTLCSNPEDSHLDLHSGLSEIETRFAQIV
jgi:hypothetical protein